MNLWSFKHYNKLDTNILPKEKSVALWSIHRRIYIAYYNYYTMDYEFLGKRYLFYDEIIDKALKIK